MHSRNSVFWSFFFFFQAEDGIRDVAVTGVQTCALPIFAAGSRLEAQSDHLQAPVFSVGTLVPLPTLWHFNGAGILALRNQQTEQAIAALARTPDPTVPSRVKSPLWKVHKPRCAHSGFLLIGNYSISPMESSIVFIRVARYPGLSLARRTPTPKARRSREAS